MPAKLKKCKRVIILGTGGNSIDILDTLHDLNTRSRTYECVGFLDDNENLWGKKISGVRVLGPLSLAKTIKDAAFANGIGNPDNFWEREVMIRKVGVPMERYETIIHPSAVISGMARLGRGTVVFQNVIVTSNVVIGDQVKILPNSVINHHVVVSDFTCIASLVSVSGNVQVGRSCYLGAGSSIAAHLTIGDYSLVGMGSVVLRSVPENTVVVGNPAKILRKTRP